MTYDLVSGEANYMIQQVEREAQVWAMPISSMTSLMATIIRSRDG